MAERAEERKCEKLAAPRRPRLLGAAGVAWRPAHFYMLHRPDLFDVPYWVLVLRLPIQAALLWLIAWSTMVGVDARR